MRTSSRPKMEMVGLGEQRKSHGESQCYYDLLAAVLTQAISDYTGGNGEEKDSAEQYLNSGDEQSLFSFISICSYLRLNAKSLKAGIERLAIRPAVCEESHFE